MKTLKVILSLILSSVVINVWIFRFNRSTMYRGGDSSNMIEEFAIYGLSEAFVYIVGAFKILAALGILIGLFRKNLIIPSALLMALLMAVALFMHFKVEDDMIKFLPAFLMLILSLSLFQLQRIEQSS